MCDGDTKRLIMLLKAMEDFKLLGRRVAYICPVCAHYNHGQGCKECVKCLTDDNFKWRGMKEG